MLLRVPVVRIVAPGAEPRPGGAGVADHPPAPLPDLARGIPPHRVSFHAASGSDRAARRQRSPAVLPLLAAVFAVAGATQVVATYGVFSSTYGEPLHVAAGMEFLSRGTYTYEVRHPPFARAVAALGPYLDGVRSFGHPNQYTEHYIPADSAAIATPGTTP